MNVLVVVIVVVFALVFVWHGGFCVSCIRDLRKSRLTFRGRENVAGIIADVGLDFALEYIPHVLSLARPLPATRPAAIVIFWEQCFQSIRPFL
jgi:hypothetical protein